MRTLRAVGGVCLSVGLTIGLVAQAEARCGDAPGDAAAVAAARDDVETTCDCAGAATHGAYVSCAAGVANARAEANLLPHNCKGQVKRCAARSTCGKPGAVTCCRTSARGTTRCSIKASASLCSTPPHGGAACVGTATSCCDACNESGCAGSPSSAFVMGLEPAGF